MKGARDVLFGVLVTDQTVALSHDGFRQFWTFFFILCAKKPIKLLIASEKRPCIEIYQIYSTVHTKPEKKIRLSKRQPDET